MNSIYIKHTQWPVYTKLKFKYETNNKEEDKNELNMKEKQGTLRQEESYFLVC